jgi:hypothetical protein
MKKQLFIFSLIVGLTAMLSSCKKEYLIDVKGNLSGQVYDQYNNPLEKALITVEGTSLKDSTDANGDYSIKGIPLGNYAVTISKAGYSTKRSNISVAPVYSTGVSNTTSGQKQSYQVGILLDEKLYALTGTATGFVTLGSVAVANARVVAYWQYYENNNYVTETFQTTTNADGIFNFTGLPLIDYTTDSYYYSSSITIAAYDSQNSDLSGSTSVSSTGATHSYPISLSQNDLQMISYTGADGKNIDTLAANSQITITFNQNVSAAITQQNGGNVTLYNAGAGYKEVATTVAYSGNKITITPSANLQPGTRYEVSFDVFATDTKSVNDNFYLNTVNTPGKPMTVTPVVLINTVNMTNYLKASTTTPNASAYEVYASSDGVTDYLLISSNNTAVTSTNGFNVNSYSKGAKFYIVPFNYDSNGNKVYGTASNIVTIP